MKLIALIFVVLFASSACGDDRSFRKFFGKYAAMKMFSTCFGEEYMAAWTKNFSIAVSYCNQQLSEDYLRDLPIDEFSPTEMYGQSGGYETGNYGEINEDNLLNYLPPGVNPYAQGQGVNPYAQVPGVNPYGQGLVSPFGGQGGVVDQSYPTSAGIYDLPNVLSALQGNITNPILLVPLPYPLLQGIAQPSFYRQKRDAPEIDAETINKVYQQIRAKAGNFTCIMKSLNYFDENFDVNVGYQMSLISEADIDAELKSDVFESMSDCIRFASCKPLSRKSLMPPAVQRAMTFMKCESKMNLASCVKNDLLKQQNKFDTEALDQLPSGSDMDLGDKMLAILYGKFNKRS